jgi:hypothetical protein
MSKSSEFLYQKLTLLIEDLDYRDKFRLAQLLLQLGRKEEEESHPENRSDAPSARPTDPEMIKYVAERVAKLRPGRRVSLNNAIAAMFQFQGSVSEEDREAIIIELQRSKHISIDGRDRVSYL